MGDRALVQFKDNNEVSPVVYLHWDGSEVKDWLQELRELMGDRFSDVSYTCARFIGVCHSHIKGNLSLGVFTQTTELSKLTRMVMPGVWLLMLKQAKSNALAAITIRFHWHKISKNKPHSHPLKPIHRVGFVGVIHSFLPHYLGETTNEHGLQRLSCHQ